MTGSHAHEHAPGDAPHADGAAHDDAFPRHETAELVAAELAARTRRERWQGPLVAFGLALVALAFPTQALFGQTVAFVERTANAELSAGALLPSALALALTRWTPLPVEPALFALSALAFGLTALPLLALARGRGWERGPALTATLLALSAPVALVAGTLASPASFALLGAALFFAELNRERGTARSRATVWLIATLLHAQLAWTWPALLVRAPHDTAPAARRVFSALAAPLVFVFACAGAHVLTHDLAHAWPHLRHELLAGGSGGPGPFAAWWTLWLPALGASGLGLVALGVQLVRARAWRREIAVLVFALVPLAALSLGGAIAWEVPWLWLVPPGALGLLELVQLADERGRGALARLALVPLCALGVGGAAWLRGFDANAAWTAQASELLDPGDVVLTASDEHRHLLRHRFHVEAVDLARVRSSTASDRALFWNAHVTVAETLRAAGRRLVLDEDSLHTSRTLVWPARDELDAFVLRAAPVRLPQIEPPAP